MSYCDAIAKFGMGSLYVVGSGTDSVNFRHSEFRFTLHCMLSR